MNFDVDIYKEEKKDKSLPQVVRLGKVKLMLDKGHSVAEIAEKLGISKTTVYKDVQFLKNIEIGGIDEETKNLRRIEIDEEILNQIKIGKEIIELHMYKKPHVVGDIMKVICNLLELRMKLWKMDAQTVLSASETVLDGEELLPEDVKDQIGDMLVKHLSKKEVKVSV